MFYVNEDTSSKDTVFYIHGGGYEHDFSPFHRLFIKKIVERTNALVIAPTYMLIPFGTYRQEYRHTFRDADLWEE
jgi:acetyl esterase/lipase